MAKILKIGFRKDRSLKSLLASLKEARRYLSEALNGDIDVSDKCINTCLSEIHSLHCQVVNYPTVERWEK